MWEVCLATIEELKVSPPFSVYVLEESFCEVKSVATGAKVNDEVATDCDIPMYWMYAAI